MATKVSHKGKGKVTASAKLTTSGINRCQFLDRDCTNGFILELIVGLIWMYKVCGLKDERAWDLFCYMIILDPVTTGHFSQFQLMYPQHRSRCSPFWEWWAVFPTYMGQMFRKTQDTMINRRWDNPHAFGDEVDCSNLVTIRSGKVKCTSKHFSWYGSKDLRGKIERPSCQQYKAGDYLAIRPLNWDEIFGEDDDDENMADAAAPNSERSRPSDGNDNDDSEGEEHTLGGERGTEKEKGTKDGKGKGKEMAPEEGKGKGKGNGKEKGIVKKTAGGDDISCAIGMQL
jgi:hypothetical protein